MNKRVRTVALALLLALTLIPQAARAAGPEEGDRYERLIKVESSGGVVVSESPQASQAGLDVLTAGGNAVDAAIATTFAIGVTRPEMCGIGAGGFLTYRGADGATATLDFRETAPAAMQPNTFNQASEGGGTDKVKQGIHNNFGTGHTVVGVPGVVAGMDEALNKLGSGNFTLADVIAPAEAYAREGITVTHKLQIGFFTDQWLFQRVADYPERARVYGGRSIHGPAGFVELNQALAALGSPGRIESPTAQLKQEDYAKSLRLIMKYGRDAFYQSTDYEEGPSIAKLIVEDMAKAEENGKLNPVLMAKTNGQPNDIGLMNKEDLESYEPIWRTPLEGHYRDHHVITMPPPASGLVVTEILNLLENFKLSEFGHSSADHIHALAEAQKLAWADRIKYLADPDFQYDFDGDGTSESVPTEVLTSKRYAQQRGSEIDMDKAKTIAEYGHGTLTPPHEGTTHTTHLSVIDRDGNAVAVTCTLNSIFGSGVVAPGTGFFLNNQLGDFDWTWPSDEPPPANAPGGGKRPRSSSSPTIVVKAGQPVLVTGGAGGPAIILGVVQNILNVVDYDLDVFHAIDAPRVDAVAQCAEQLGVEHPRIPEAVQNVLADRGHSICQVAAAEGGYAFLPIITSTGTDLSTGNRLAVSDPRGFTPSDEDQGPAGQ